MKVKDVKHKVIDTEYDCTAAGKEENNAAKN